MRRQKTILPSPSSLLPTRAVRRARVQDWPTLLFHFIEARRPQLFAWGRQDCCLFACDGILAQTGLDPAAGLFRGQYRDALGAARLVRKHGGVEAIAASVCAAHGWPELPTPRLAQRGDVVLIYTADDKTPVRRPTERVALGLCLGDHAVVPGPVGLEKIPIRDCAKAWRIG